MSDLQKRRDRDSKTVSLARGPHFRVNTQHYEEEDEYFEEARDDSNKTKQH
jgi:hypothetical protein